MFRRHCRADTDAFAQNAPDLTAPFRKMADSGEPIVFVDHMVPRCSAPLVASDNLLGGMTATDYLIRQHGCRTVFVIAASGSQAANERVEGHVRYMRDKFGKKYVPRVVTEHGSTEHARHASLC